MRKIGFSFKVFILVSLFFLTYQLYMLIAISEENVSNKQNTETLVRGIHEKQNIFYKPSLENTFKCFQSNEEIDYSKVNDDYCDCLDGTDEPGTNACSNGFFYCRYQSTSSEILNVISSCKVNDGICDCCDGSDEWDTSQFFNLKSMHIETWQFFVLKLPEFNF